MPNLFDAECLKNGNANSTRSAQVVRAAEGDLSDCLISPNFDPSVHLKS